MEKKLRIIFISQVTILDITERNIYCDLIKEFLLQGHHVDIFTAFERRNTTKFKKSEKASNYTITRIKTPNLQKTSKFEKALGHILFDRIVLKALKNTLDKKNTYDIVLYYTPPITIIKTLKYLKEQHNTFNYLLLKDIFPQNAVDIGLMRKNSLSHRYFRKMEEKFYKLSDMIGCMSPKNVSYLLQNHPYLSPEKVECNPNSVSISTSTSSSTGFKEKFKIHEDATLFIYGGNLGLPQGVDFIIRLLEKNKNNKKIHFLIIGSGTEYPKLERWVQKNEPNNISLAPFLPKYEYDQAVQSSDIGLIFLDYKFTIPNFPSRLLTYLEHKKPVLAFTDINTDIGEIIKENEFGDWSPSNNCEKATQIIELFANFERSHLQQLGENAYQFLLDNYLVKDSYNKIVSAYDNYFYRTK